MVSTQQSIPVAFGHHGRRVLPSVIDENARRKPDREVFQIPNNPSDPSAGWRVITWKSYANAVNRCAHRIVSVCGPAPENKFPTIAYIGPNDARYVVIMIAAVKAGYKALFISPRNSHDGQLNLFDKTDCQVLAFPSSHRGMVTPWLQERPSMQAIEVGSVDSWFPDTELPPFPYTKTFEQCEWDPLIVLHTSGSTGLPKPVIVKAGMMAVSDAMWDLPKFQGAEFQGKVVAEKSNRQFVPMPLFHAGALFTFVMNALWYETPVALAPGDRPLSSDLVLECLRNVHVESALLPPATLEDMSQSDEHIAELVKLKMVLFGGGNLAREAGNRLVKNGVHLANFIGATEFAPFPIYWQEDRQLWQYFVFNVEQFGIDWRKHPSSEGDTYELVVVRKGKHPGWQGFFYTFPEAEEYSTKDLYRPHPQHPNHWLYVGRSDNIIVFSNGEKLNPVTIEEIVTDHPGIKGALVVGSQRFQPALIVEPVKPLKNKDEEKKFLDSIWPLVVQANKETVAHGQIGRDFMAVSNPNKPFLRASKDTIQRAGTVKLYKDEIDKLYEQAGNVESFEAPRLDVSSPDTLVQSIEELFKDRLGAPQLEPDTDFFSAGIDSMQVINASRLLRAGLEGAGYSVDSQSLATRVIYGNPTPRRLAKYIMQSVIADDGNNAHNEDAEQQQAMKFLWEKYTRALVTGANGRPEASSDGQTVLLTGSTGMLGSYLLDLMVRNPTVKKVVCLNRAEDGGAKQQVKAMRERGLDTTYGGGKAEFHHVDTSQTNFGLSRDVYSRLLKEADRVIHNAWPVNFNITVETFEPHLRGTRNVADFAAGADKRVAVVFISSIATGHAWKPKNGPMPEKRFEDLSVAGGGYGRSKMIGSLILEDAAKVGDFPATIVRVGQVAGPESEAGAWNRQEWFPSIVASSLHLKALPRSLGNMNRVDWTPAERIAKLVLEVVGVSEPVKPENISGYFHGVNPNTTTFEKLVQSVQEFYGKERIPEVIDFKQWVDRLEKSQSDSTVESIDKNPGVKLIDFYRGLNKSEPVVFETARTVQHSRTMRTSTAVTDADMKRWCTQWGYT